jgi:hypothetical protein
VAEGGAVEPGALGDSESTAEPPDAARDGSLYYAGAGDAWPGAAASAERPLAAPLRCDGVWLYLSEAAGAVAEWSVAHRTHVGNSSLPAQHTLALTTTLG